MFRNRGGLASALMVPIVVSIVVSIVVVVGSACALPAETDTGDRKGSVTPSVQGDSTDGTAEAGQRADDSNGESNGDVTDMSVADVTDADVTDADVTDADVTDMSVVDATDADPSDGDAVWTIVDVVDGDTVRVSGPDGVQTVRLIGINTPERGECFADEATSALEKLTAGKPIRLVADRTDVDGYGRLLRFIETVDGGDVGGALVEDGFALSRRYEPDVSRNDRYDALQSAAEAAEAGLWASDACGDPAVDRSAVSIDVFVQADAPGDDGQNLNGEWVRFTNTGESPVDLSGWEVADESASHRFRFGPVIVDSGASVVVYSGCGDDTPAEWFWCNQGSAVWNNSGDTVFLRDPSGNVVVSLSYGG